MRSLLRKSNTSIKKRLSYLIVELSLTSQHEIHCHPPLVLLFHLPLLSNPQTLTSAFSSSHISACPLILTSTERQQSFAHLTERCRISVRDLLMLLAILISSFSSESVYWASWSRLRAQSALFASSSACTVCGKRRPRISRTA